VSREIPVMLIAMENGIRAYLGLLAQRFYEVAIALGGPGLLVVALVDSSFLSLPEGNDLLIIILSTGQGWGRMSYLVMMTIAGSAAGCTVLYWVGRRGGTFMEKPPRGEKLRKVGKTYQEWGVWAIVIPSILPPPTPFKVFVLSAGLFKVPFPRFIAAVLVGRSIRYSMWGILAVLYGEWAKQFLEESLETVGIILLVILVAGIVTYVALRIRKRRITQAEETM
jgi:membrane protein DedA with SNARE-associated domain